MLLTGYTVRPFLHVTRIMQLSGGVQLPWKQLHVHIGRGREKKNWGGVELGAAACVCPMCPPTPSLGCLVQPWMGTQPGWVLGQSESGASSRGATWGSQGENVMPSQNTTEGNFSPSSCWVWVLGPILRGGERHSCPGGPWNLWGSRIMVAMISQPWGCVKFQNCGSHGAYVWGCLGCLTKGAPSCESLIFASAGRARAHVAWLKAWLCKSLIRSHVTSTCTCKGMLINIAQIT